MIATAFPLIKPHLPATDDFYQHVGPGYGVALALGNDSDITNPVEISCLPVPASQTSRPVCGRARTGRRWSPRHIVVVPGSPLPLWRRNPPREAMMHTASRRGWRCKMRSAVDDLTGHMSLFLMRQHDSRQPKYKSCWMPSRFFSRRQWSVPKPLTCCTHRFK